MNDDFDFLEGLFRPGELPQLRGRKVVGHIELPGRRQSSINRYKKGDAVMARITQIVEYGAFACFDGYSGLIHVNEIYPNAKRGEIDKILDRGQEVKCFILDIKERGKVALTMRDPESTKVIMSGSCMSGQSLIKSIWNAHIDVEEQLLQERQAPIRVVESSSQVVGDKLYLTVYENSQPDGVLNDIANAFNIDKDELTISEGYFEVEVEKAKAVSESKKHKLSEQAENNFIKFSPNPIIDGIVSQVDSSLEAILKGNDCVFSFGRNGRLEISLSDLKRIEKKLESAAIHIQEKASVILRFSPSPLWYLSKLFPNIPWQFKSSFIQIEKDGGDEKGEAKIAKVQRIVLNNGYLSDDVLRILSEHHLKLSLSRYSYAFRINSSVMHLCKSSYDLPEVCEDGCTFRFDTQLGDAKEEENDNEGLAVDEKIDFNFKFTRLMRTFIRIFGSENISYESQFEYSFGEDFWEVVKSGGINEELWGIIKQCYQDDKQVLLSRDKQNVGIDFNWREETLKNILERVSSVCPYITLSYHDNHRCNIDLLFNNDSLADVERNLRRSFPSIQFYNNANTGTLYFFQEYSDRAKRNQIERSLRDELTRVCSYKYSFKIYSVPCGKEKYYIKVDNDSLCESLSESVNGLRGSEFSIYDGIKIGKLFRVKFPQIVFDISSVDCKEEIKRLSDAHSINSVTPNLKGDIEKIYRLKSSLRLLSDGKNLINSNLSEFIFDAAKAAPIENIECYTTPQSDYYRDIDSNLLNGKVNESQKQAIIKCLLAQDLAIIQGPPGTGKSTAIAEILWQHVRKDPEERILLASETNLAVDNAIARVVNPSNNLVKPIRLGEVEKLEMEGWQFSFDALRMWKENCDQIYSDEDGKDGDSMVHKKQRHDTILDNWLLNISRRVDICKLGDEASSLWLNLLQSPPKSIRDVVFKNYIQNCNVVGATCSSIGVKNTDGYPTKFFQTYRDLFSHKYKDDRKSGLCKNDPKIEFSTVIQDEASKATPAELSLPLIYGKKNIIIGDHRQLPPLLDKDEFVKSMQILLKREKDERKKREIKKLLSFVQQHFKDLEISHFQRLFESIDNSLKGVFNQQYRMHPAINEVIKQFYVDDGGLFCGLDQNQVEDPNISNPQSRYHGLSIEDFIEPETHVVWIDANTPEMLVGTSRVNYGEVEAIRKVLLRFNQSESFKQYENFWTNEEDKQIGLISFYGKQLKLLDGLKSEYPDIPLRISTVDRFQGMERNIIIVSMVRSHIIAADKNQQPDYDLYPEFGFAPQNDLGFAQSPNRLNVALSRAKRLLIVVGNSNLFRQKQIYDNVYNCIANSPNGKILKAEEL